MRKRTVPALAILVLSFAALADVAAERKEGTERLEQSVKALNERCGTTLTASFDWATAEASPPRGQDQYAAYCKNIVDGLATACDGALGKATVAGHL